MDADLKNSTFSDRLFKANEDKLIQLTEQLKIQFREHNFLITVHPETLTNNTEDLIKNLCTSLSDYANVTLLFTAANVDTQGWYINIGLENFIKQHTNMYFFHHLGIQKFISLMKEVDLVLGNSSSGIIEAPLLKTPTINIGSRQKGRLRAKSIIDCDIQSASIKTAIDKALSPEFQKIVEQSTSVYGVGETSKKILNILKTVNLTHLVTKQFFDL